MYDKSLVLEILEQILQASQRILKRFEQIKSPDDFTESESGIEKLDAIYFFKIESIPYPYLNFVSINSSAYLYKKSYSRVYLVYRAIALSFKATAGPPS